MVISSQAVRALACRGPWDVVNLAGGWGLGKERGVEALGREARGCVVGAEMRRTSFRGVVDVVFGGEKPKDEKEVSGKGKGSGKMLQNGKRKAEDDGLEKEAEKPLSKTQMRKRAKQAKIERAEGIDDGTEKTIAEPEGSKGNGDNLMAVGKGEG